MWFRNADPDPAAPPPWPGQAPDRFRPLNRRRRLLIVLLAVGTAVAGVTTLLSPPGGVKRPAPGHGPDAVRCGNGQTENCVGGTSAVLLPAAPAAPPAPAKAASGGRP